LEAEPVITFNFDTMKWEGITVDQVKFWEGAYPELDVVDLLTKKIPVWLDANPRKASQYKDWKKFIVNWFNNESRRIKLWQQRS
jgi:hypothetical protein